MNVYQRNRKNYTLTVKLIDGRYHPQIVDNTNGNTWTGGGYAHRDVALMSVQRKYDEISSK